MSNEREMPNAALRVLLDALAEVMGENGMKAVLNAGQLSHYITAPQKKIWK